MRLETTLGEVLQKAGELPWDHHLYVPRTEQLMISSPVIVLNDDEEVERSINNEPLYTESTNVKYLLYLSAVQDVVENLQKQVNNPSIEQLFEALKYYVEKDAFIKIT